MVLDYSHCTMVQQKEPYAMSQGPGNRVLEYRYLDRVPILDGLQFNYLSNACSYHLPFICTFIEGPDWHNKECFRSS